MSRRKQANPKSLKTSIDNLKLQVDEDKTAPPVGKDKVKVIEPDTSSSTDDEDERVRKKSQDTSSTSSSSSSASMSPNIDIENNNRLSKSSQVDQMTINQTSDSFLKNMTNNQSDLIESRKQQHISKLDHQADQISGKIGFTKVVPLVSTRSSSSSSVNSAVSSSQTSVDDDVSKSVLNQDEEVAMNESQQNEDEDEIVVDDMDTTVNTGNEPDGSTDNEEDEEDEPRTVVKSSVPAKNNDSYGKRGRRQRQRTNLGSGGGKSLGHQDSSILINGKRYYRLIFACENCGIRYSDQSALNTHKQNYCVKRNQTSQSPPSVTNKSSDLASSQPQWSARSRSSSGASDSEPGSPSTVDNDNSSTDQENSHSSFGFTKKPSLTPSNVAAIDQDEKKTAVAQPGVQLLKSVIYQCNNCLFQTDKKTAMNRHSRVHLAQKRKQMEELSSQNSSVAGGSDSGVKKALVANDGPNDKSKSYCKDCDIQFSSIVTYQHHRNNYCQKYKTIESVVPVEVNPAVSQDLKSVAPKPQKVNPVPSVMSPKPELCNIKPQVRQPTELIAPAPIVTPITAPAGLPVPPNAVRMGDLVYLPVFKLNDAPPNRNLLPAKEAIDENNNSTKPLDLSSKSRSGDAMLSGSEDDSDSVEQSNNMPLDLSIKGDKTPLKNKSSIDYSKTIPSNTSKTPKLTDLAQTLAAAVTQQHRIPTPNPTALTSFDLINRQLAASFNTHLYPPASLFNRIQGGFLPPISQHPAYNFLNSIRFSQSIPATHSNELPANLQQQPNKIYHCVNCQKFFLKFKHFKRHDCEAKMSKEQKMEKTPAPVKHETSTRTESPEDSKKENPKIEPADTSIDPLLKHPLVRQTLREMYGREFDKLTEIDDSANLGYDVLDSGKTSSSKNFYMCTTCGYRGNTSRGVKQHGKMHLSAREHFGIINATTSKPYLVYNSLDDSSLGHNHGYNHGSEATVKRELEIEDTEKSQLEEESEATCGVRPTSQPIQSVNQPFSKKARLLEYNNSRKDEETQDDEEDEAKIERPQTFCHKCSTQFQHVNNFLAHKKFYCKDD